MATGSVISNEDVNYVRLQILVGKIGTGALREYFNNSPIFGQTVLQGTLASKRILLQTLKTRGIVNASQWDLLYPPGGAVPTSDQFDLTLLVLLLRNYGAVGVPRHFNWAQLPLPTDVAIYHDIARLKYHRNKYAHTTSGIDDADFLTDWKEIEVAILRIVPTTKKTQFIVEIKNLLTSPLSQEDLEKHLVDRIRKLQILTRKSTKTIVDNTNTRKQELEFKINQNTAALQTHIDKASEDQTATLQTSFTQALDNQRKQLLHEIKQKSELEGEHTVALLDAFARKLKKVYKDRFHEVQSVSSGGDPTMFDVTSKLYMDLDCTPLEMRCTLVNDKDKPGHERNLKRQKEYPDDGTDKKRQKKSDTVSSQEPVPSTSNTNSVNGKQDKRNVKINTGGIQENIPTSIASSQIPPNEKLDNPAHGKLTTTSQISRLFTADENPDLLPILFEAEAGVGKTTLFHRLALDWANGSKNMEQFKLVFLIPLRRVKSKKIEDIICDDLHLLLPDHKRDLNRCLDLWDNQILFLIDGLDEVTLAHDSDVKKLLQGTEKHVFCSSRPILHDTRNKTKYHGMQQFMLVKLIGFSDETLVKYINQYFRKIGDNDENMADKIMTECSKHFYCWALIKIPLYAYLLCFLSGKYDIGFPDTATQIFNRFLMEILNNYLIRYSHSIDTCNNTLHIMTSADRVQFSKSPLEKIVPPQIRRILKSISKLAYTALMEQKVIFTLQDADECDLSLADLTHIGLFTIEEEDGSLIYFRHKLFQEYFAGLYLTLQKGDINKLFSDSRDEIINRCHILQNAFFFAAGLCGDTYGIIAFALQYSLHPLKSSDHRKMRRFFDLESCENCPKLSDEMDVMEMSLSKSRFYYNHIGSCDICNKIEEEQKHEFDIEMITECDKCYIIANAMMYPESIKCKNLEFGNDDEIELEVLSFFVQLYFEHHAIDDDIHADFMGQLARLPVHCSSAHSLAAAMYVLQMKQKHRTKTDSPVSIVLIGWPAFDMDHLLCVLRECNNSEDMQCITVMEAGETLITEILNMEWQHVKKIGFVDCATIVPLKRVLHTFPNVEMALYDKNTWRKERTHPNSNANLASIDDMTVIVKDFRCEDIQMGNLQSLKACSMLTPEYTTFTPKRTITVWVQDYEKWPEIDREKYLPGSVLKGVCGVKSGRDYENALTVVVNNYGLQWKHLMTDDPGDSVTYDQSPEVCYIELDTAVIRLSKKGPHVDYFGRFVEVGKKIFEVLHVLFKEAGRQLWNGYFETKRTGIDEVMFMECETLVPVDVVAENLPDVSVIAYDHQTLHNGRPFAETQNSEITCKREKNVCLTFGEFDPYNSSHHRQELSRGDAPDICTVCTVCGITDYRNINIVLETARGFPLVSSHSYHWKRLIRSSESVRGLCWQLHATPYPCFQHLEYFHTSNTRFIAEVYDRNPDLKVVALDVTFDSQDELPRVYNETLEVLQGSRNQWRGSCFVFDCNCVFEFTHQGGRKIDGKWGIPCFKPFEIALDKVQGWGDKNFEKLNEQELFVLQHHMLHKATKRKRKKGKSFMCSKEQLTSWMTEKNSKELNDLNINEPFRVNALYFEKQSIHVNFTREDSQANSQDSP